MSQERQKTKKELILSERTPKKVLIKKGQESTFKMKDEHFEGRILQYIDSKNNDKTGSVEAIHRNIVIRSQKITCHKGDCISLSDLSAFDDGAKAHWLEDTKPKKEKKEKSKE